MTTFCREYQGRWCLSWPRVSGSRPYEEDLQPYDLYTADEVFFSRTSPRIMPVSQVDKRPIGSEIPGPVTRQLLVAHSELVGVDIVGQSLHYAGIKE